MTTCPVSWLRLEQYALRELAGPAADEVETHLASCAACRNDLTAIREDVDPMPALPVPPASTWRWPSWGWAVPAMALAAALVVAVRVGTPPTHKGGEVAISIVVARGSQVIQNPASYADGDRVQVQLTCPESAGTVPWRLVVFEGAAAGVELANGDTACGNQVLLPHAFEVTGTEPLRVCLTVSSAITSWNSPEALGPESACAQLAPPRR